MAVRSGQSLASLGTGTLDVATARDDSRKLVQEMNMSVAMTPWLIPQAAFKCGHVLWLDFAWLLSTWVGPSLLSMRANVWRLAQLGRKGRQKW